MVAFTAAWESPDKQDTELAGLCDEPVLTITAFTMSYCNRDFQIAG